MGRQGGLGCRQTVDHSENHELEIRPKNIVTKREKMIQKDEIDLSLDTREKTSVVFFFIEIGRVLEKSKFGD